MFQPPSCIPVSLYSINDHLAISIPAAYYLPTTPTQLDQPATWKKFIGILTPWERRLVGQVRTPCHATLVSRLSTYTADPIIIVSDGSFKHCKGAFGWTMEQHTDTLASCYGPVGGCPVTVLRTECYAILSWILFLGRFCEFYGVSPPAPIQPYSDSKTAIGYTIRSDSSHFTTKPMRPDYDITCHLHSSFISLRAAIPLLANIHHIPGHSLEQPMTRQALLIIQVDKETKLERLRPRLSFSEPSPECPAYLI